MNVNVDLTWQQYIGGFEEVLAGCCTPVERKKMEEKENGFK